MKLEPLVHTNQPVVFLQGDQGRMQGQPGGLRGERCDPVQIRCQLTGGENRAADALDPRFGMADAQIVDLPLQMRFKAPLPRQQPAGVALDLPGHLQMVRPRAGQIRFDSHTAA